jgi:transposase
MKFRRCDPNQTKFVNLDYRAILGENSEAVIIHNIIEVLNLSKFEEKYVEIGNPAYHPKMMMKIIIYGYVRKYFGGRPLHNNYETDLGLRFLSNDDFPDFRTINLFRVNFKEEIVDIFSQVVMLCKELDMLGFENLSIDGQKIKANANVFQNKNLKSIRKEKERIEKQLKKLLEKELDFQQDMENKAIINKKKEKLEKRKIKLDMAAQLLIDAGAENDDKMRYNLTDPDSRAMTDKRGVKNPDYNTQNAVDDKFQVLTAVDVTNNPIDNEELFPMTEKSKENTGKNHENTLADSGYGDKAKFVEMEKDDDTEYYVPDKTMHSSKKDPYCKWNFKKDSDRDVYICPEGRELHYQRTSKDSKGLIYWHYVADDCSNCKVRGKCQKISKKKVKKGVRSNRSINIYKEDECVKRMRKKLETDEGKKIYQRRMSTVEPLHGDIQKNRGFIQFALRGLKKVKIEYNLIGIAHNVRKIKLHAADALKKYVNNA